MADEKNEKRLEPVVDQTVLARKNPKKAVKTFFPESLASVGSYILRDIIVPAVKNLLDDTISKGTHALLWGNSASPTRSRSREDSVSYERYYKRPSSTSSAISSTSRLSKKYTTVYDYTEVEFSSMGKAEKVLMNMRSTINRYKICSVRDMYDLAETVDENGKPVGSSTDARYGWYTLNEDEAKVVSYGGKWYLDLPKAVPLDE